MRLQIFGCVKVSRRSTKTLGVASAALLAFCCSPLRVSRSHRNNPQHSRRSNPRPEKENSRAAPAHKGPAGELVEEKRESTGEDEEENANLKHASAVRWMARMTGLVSTRHISGAGTELRFYCLVIVWAARKYVPGILRDRNAIQRALEEARAASQDANRRLAEIENRLRQLDVEIGQMQASCGKRSRCRRNPHPESCRRRYSQSGAGRGAGNRRRRQTGPPRTVHPYRRAGHLLGPLTDQCR